MATKKTQAHKVEILNIFAVAALTVTAITFQEKLTATMITMAVITYFFANIIYALATHTLDATRVIEFGLIAFIAQFIAITYLI